MAPNQVQNERFHVQVYLRGSRHRSLLSLPHDVLIRIIAYVIKGYLPPCELGHMRMRKTLDPIIARLSTVCRTFRHVIADMVWLWTEIDGNFCLRDNFNDLISRSKAAPLRIDIVLSKGDWKKILSRIVPFRDRWQTLSLAFKEVDSVDVAETFPKLEFPCLERASVFFKKGDEDYQQFFMEWRFPRLIDLELQDAVPPLGLLPKLVYFRMFVYGTTHEAAGWELLDVLLQFLHDTRSLEVLDLDLAGICTLVEEELVAVELPNIKKIVISNVNCSDYNFEPYVPIAMGRAIRAIRAPNVQECQLMIDFVHGEHVVEEWISSFASDQDILKYVTHLRVNSDHTKFNEASLPKFLALFPNVKYLISGIPDFCETLVRSGRRLNLEQLNCLSIDDDQGNEETLRINLVPAVALLCSDPSKVEVKFGGGFFE